MVVAKLHALQVLEYHHSRLVLQVDAFNVLFHELVLLMTVSLVVVLVLALVRHHVVQKLLLLQHVLLKYLKKVIMSK